jgi:hydrogenase expression/formation protein HypE
MPLKNPDRVLLAHGGGGTLMHRMIEQVFLSAFNSRPNPDQHDAATITAIETNIAFTTDSFVVNPLFFPGGNIGSLAVHGTVNDLAMSGAKPAYLSAAFILEEGFHLADLQRIVQSMALAAREAGVQIITGDTKVVDRGKGDGAYINTSGIGFIHHHLNINPTAIQTGDAVIVSGDIGRHGIAIMAQRESLQFESTIESDSAAVHHLVQCLLNENIEIHCLRDLTRGGLASALNEIATAANHCIELNETHIPIRNDVNAACEILGIDPLYVACEGRFIAFVPQAQARKVLELLHNHPNANSARIIGVVKPSASPIVTMITQLETTRVVDMQSGEQLPRIC